MKEQEVLTSGYLITSAKRVSQVAERAKVCDYLVLPKRFNFGKAVRVVVVVL